MIQASFCRYIENTVQQQNEMSQLKEKLQKLENSKNGFNRAQEIIESGEPLIYDRKSIIEGVSATRYPSEDVCRTFVNFTVANIPSLMLQNYHG